MQKLRNVRNCWVNFSELSNLVKRNHDKFDAICRKHWLKTKANSMKFWAQFFAAVKILVYLHYSNRDITATVSKMRFKSNCKSKICTQKRVWA